MMIIRNEQLEALITKNHLSFKARLRSHIQVHFPAVFSNLKPHELNSFLDEGIARTQKYNLETEYQITAYFNIMMLLGPNFEVNDQYKWMVIALNDEEVTAEEKVNKLIIFLKEYEHK